MYKRLEDYLENLKIKYKIHKHVPVFTVLESRKIKKKIPGLHTKCLFMKDENDSYYLIALPAEKKLDVKALRKKLGLKKLFFASPEELKAELNLTPGSVSIFGMIYASKTFLIIDFELWNAKIVNFHPNINTETLEIPHAGLEKFYNSLKSKKEIMIL